jgi:general secretion pathway protein A
MYSQFFGFNKLPFRLRPDPEFLYSSQEYLRARSSLIAALRGSSRATLLIGPPGVGKTLLLDEVLRELGAQCAVCRINQPQISAPELLQALMLQLGEPVGESESSESSLLKDPSGTLEAAGKRLAPALLIIDDAQMLPNGTLLALRRILAKTQRLKMLLIARQDPRQPSDDTLSRLAVVEQQSNIRLDPLSADGIRAYIEHRLRLAGAGGKDLFTPDAFSVIYQHTAGSPRLINVLCDAALHGACLRASGHVSASEIVLASQDARWPEALARDKAAIAIDETINAQSVAAESATPPSVSAATAHGQSGSAQFIISYRKTHLGSWPLQAGRISIGRADDNVLRLEAPEISRHHCEVNISADASVIEDLGSVNGIIVNGKAVKRHILKHADVVRLGEHVLKYVVS